MIPNSVDVATRISPNLAALIESRAKDPYAEEPPTLHTVRSFLAGLVPETLNETERLHHFDIDDSLFDELDALIEQYGEDALAIDFLPGNASEPLSSVIEALVNDENREFPPTLDTVKEAILSGLPARLIGDGVLEDDDDEALLAELEGLIRRYGGDSHAEEFLRYD